MNFHWIRAKNHSTSVSHPKLQSERCDNSDSARFVKGCKRATRLVDLSLHVERSYYHLKLFMILSRAGNQRAFERSLLSKVVFISTRLSPTIGIHSLKLISDRVYRIVGRENVNRNHFGNLNFHPPMMVADVRYLWEIVCQI